MGKDPKRKTLIVCPNCGKAYLVRKELHPGTLEGKDEMEFIYECPICKVLFHEEQL